MNNNTRIENIKSEESIRNQIIWLTVISSILVIVIIICFFNNRILDCNKQIDNAVWGNFGDIIGGVFGTLFTFVSVLLMFKTFQLQRTLTENSDNLQIKQTELQRFNNLFFELQSLYINQESVLNASNGGTPYFNGYMSILRNDFKEYVKYGNAYYYASIKYQEFYGRHSWEVAPHFRILYRILNLIDNASIDDEYKQEYAKIIRAQLSEGELFFIRYNCTTNYGNNLKEYVNKYRLLKHLPFLSLLEAKKFKNIIQQSGRDNDLMTNQILYDIWKQIYNRVTGKTALSFHPVVLQSSSKYQIILVMTNRNNMVLHVEKDNSIRRTPKRLEGFEAMTSDELLELMYAFIREIFIFSNFDEYNPNIKITKNIHQKQKNDKSITTLIVVAKNDTPLRLSHYKWDNHNKGN